MEFEGSYGFVKPYLTNGEYVLWRGKPDKGHYLSKSDLYLIPFSFLWCGFACFWEFSVIRDQGGFFALFGIPFVIVGLYISIGRFFHMAWLRKRTYYVITNLKVIRLQHKKVDMLMGNNLPPVSVEIYKNGNGTIRFRQMTQYPYKRGAIQIYGMEKGLCTLENIPDVVRVQQYLTQIASQ